MARAALRPHTTSRLRSASGPGTAKSAPRTVLSRLRRGGKADRPAPKAARKPSSRPPREPKPARERRRPPLIVRLLVMLVALAAMVAFAAVLAKLTLQPSPASEALTHNNIHPGRSLQAYLDQPELRDAVKQIGGNIVLGIPFGVLLPLLVPGTRGILRVTLLTALAMLLVEVVQGTFITGRAFDIDDVILNTSGALIGYLLLGRRMSRAVHPRRLNRKAEA
ncbi:MULTISPECIES: VanZ family protein [Streptomyces]|uniref:VanZ family protein n=1 Tax=Streptomyces apricus TaxID=1828112 RepID=A0A5B0BMB9_9ACTN|nr:VanZ family protein [Streptomyces apricus]